MRKLGLKGSLSITNVLLKTTAFYSKLVNFEISSASHPDKIKMPGYKNKISRLVSDLDNNYQNFDIENLKLPNKHLKASNIPPLILKT